MLTKEAYTLLTLLSANDAKSLMHGLRLCGSRWTLEAINFRLMNRLVEGLEDLATEADNIHFTVQQCWEDDRNGRSSSGGKVYVEDGEAAGERT